MNFDPQSIFYKNDERPDTRNAVWEEKHVYRKVRLSGVQCLKSRTSFQAFQRNLMTPHSGWKCIPSNQQRVA
jgi:hypothetical protein